MPRPTRSLQHEYERYLEQEIENYKESVPRTVLLGIGDEAVAALARQAQFTLTELIVWEEVDRIIARRLRLPSATTWRRRRSKLIEELRRPERWGMTANHVLVRGLSESPRGSALVAGSVDENPTLYFAANGCTVTALDHEAEAVERVMQAAVQAGLGDRVNPCVGDLQTWAPTNPLYAVVLNRAALSFLAPAERPQVMQHLQAATIAGGIHLVDVGVERDSAELEEWRTLYPGWRIEFDVRSAGGSRLVATKTA